MGKLITHYDVIGAKEYHDNQQLYQCAQAKADRVKNAYHTLYNINTRQAYDAHLNNTKPLRILWKIIKPLLIFAKWILLLIGFILMVMLFFIVYSLISYYVFNTFNQKLAHFISLLAALSVWLTHTLMLMTNRDYRLKIQRLKDWFKPKIKLTLYEEIYANPNGSAKEIKESAMKTKAAVDTAYQALLDAQTRAKQDSLINENVNARYRVVAIGFLLAMTIMLVIFQGG